MNSGFLYTLIIATELQVTLSLWQVVHVRLFIREASAIGAELSHRDVHVALGYSMIRSCLFGQH